MVWVKINNPTTPSSAKTTDSFQFNIYRNFVSAPNYGLSDLLLTGTVQIASTKFISGTITGGTFEGGLEYIQTDNPITVSFTIKNALPFYQNGGSHPKIVLIMPQVMEETAGDSDIVLGLDGSIRSQYMN